MEWPVNRANLTPIQIKCYIMTSTYICALFAKNENQEPFDPLFPRDNMGAFIDGQWSAQEINVLREVAAALPDLAAMESRRGYAAYVLRALHSPQIRTAQQFDLYMRKLRTQPLVVPFVFNV